MNCHADKIIDLYERHAHDYVANRRRVLWNESAWLDRFTSLAQSSKSLIYIRIMQFGGVSQ